jgi:hypothetical protein
MMITPAQSTTRGPLRRTLVIALAAVTLAALTACAGPSSPSPVVTHHPVAQPTSPGPVQAAAPTPPGHVTCAALASLAAVRAAVGATDVDLLPFSEDAMQIPDVGMLAVPQDGGLSCIWQDAGAQADLNIDLIPNATAQLAAAAPTLAETDQDLVLVPASSVPVYGDRSWTHCLDANLLDPGNCQFDIQVGSYWIEVYGKYFPAIGSSSSASAVNALLDGIVIEVRGLPRAPTVWQPPTESASFPTTCDAAGPLATLRTDFGDPALAADSLDATVATEANATPSGVAAAVTNSLDCDWQGDVDSVSVVLQPGSSWAWTATAGPTDAAEAGFTRVPGIGSSAWVSCVQVTDSVDPTEFSCYLIVLVGHSWLELNAQASGLTQAEMVAAGRDISTTPVFAS